MENKIVVITSKYLHEYVENTYKKLDLDCTIEVVEYTDFKTAGDIYRQYEDSCIGFLVSGNVIHDVIVKAVPDHKKPIVYFKTDSAGFYRLLLECFTEKKNLDTKRIVLDFLIPMYEEASIDFFMNGLELPLIQTDLDKWLDTSTQEDLNNVENMVAEKIIELWNANKIDRAICLYSSIIPRLEAHGIPCKYPYPDEIQLSTMAKTVISQSKLKDLHENLPAVIALEPNPAPTEDQHEEIHTALKEAMRSIKNSLALDVIIKEEGNGYHIYTSRRIIDLLTDDQSLCHLKTALKEDYNLSVSIGYGIGHSITIAKMHAEEALKEALFNNDSFVMNESRTLVGPLNAEKRLEVQGVTSQKIAEFADKCKLSTFTIQKLISITKMNNTNKLTTQQLADRLGVTVRNANRILKNLVDGGVADIAYTHSTKTKGRPLKVYELKF